MNKYIAEFIGTMILVFFGTGTSVNPARALAPAVFTGGEALAQVWLFIVAPLIGGAIAAVFYRAWFSVKED